MTCSKCGGFLISDKYVFGGTIVYYVRCLNCGKVFFKNENKKVIICKSCGREIPYKNLKNKLCYSCSSEKTRKKKIYICKVCGKEFKAFSTRSGCCSNCRKRNINIKYINKGHLIATKILEKKQKEVCMFFLLNAFSPSMLTSSVAKVSFTKISQYEAKRLFSDMKNNIEAAIGHEGTAKLVSSILETPIKAERKEISLITGDCGIIVTLTFRPEEGRVYDFLEICKLHDEKKIAFYYFKVI